MQGHLYCCAHFIFTAGEENLAGQDSFTEHIPLGLTSIPKITAFKTHFNFKQVDNQNSIKKDQNGIGKEQQKNSHHLYSIKTTDSSRRSILFTSSTRG